MRDLAFAAVMLGLVGLAVARPFVGVLVWSWVSFMSPHREVWGFAQDVPWAGMIFGATVIGCLVAGEPRRSAFNAVTGLLLLLLACVTVTSLAALGPAEAVWDKWAFAAKVILALLLTNALLTDRWRIHALVWMMVLSLGYYGVKGGAFTILTAGNYRVWGPPATMITDNNHLAAALLVALPLMNYLRLQSRHPLVRHGLAAAMLLTTLATVGSYSRGALLGLGAVTFCLWLQSRRKLVMGVLLCAGLAGLAGFMPERWTDRMNSIASYQEDGSATERLVLWEISWKLALERPLTGAGFRGAYTREVVDRVAPGGPARAVHSIWFEFLGEHGFPAFAVWLGLTVAGIRASLRLRRLARGRPELAWAHDLARMGQLSIVAYLVAGSFLSLSYWDFYWTLLVVLGASHALVAREIRAEAESRPAGTTWRRLRQAAPIPAPVPAALAGAALLRP